MAVLISVWPTQHDVELRDALICYLDQQGNVDTLQHIKMC